MPVYDEENRFRLSDGRLMKADTGIPMTFPATKVALWDHQATGPAAHIGLTYYRDVRVSMSKKTLSLAQRYATDSGRSLYYCLFVGSLQVDSDNEGVVVSIDTFDPGHSSNECFTPLPSTSLSGDIHVPFQIKQSPETTTTDWSTSIKVLRQRCQSKGRVDCSQFISLRGACFCRTSPNITEYKVELDMVSMATGFRATPVKPVPIMTTALSKNLSGPNSMSQLQGEPKTGYLTMDQTRKLLLVLESDPKAFSLPLVGIWVSGITHVYNPFVWAACLRYLRNSSIQDRLCKPPEPFLIVVYSQTHSRPEFYDCTLIKQTTPDLCLYTGCETFSMTKEPARNDEKYIQIELCAVEHGKKKDEFDTALHSTPTCFDSPAQKPGVDSAPKYTEDDYEPRASPSPHLAKTTSIMPSVPDVSLVFDSDYAMDSHPRPREPDSSLPHTPSRQPLKPVNRNMTVSSQSTALHRYHSPNHVSDDNGSKGHPQWLSNAYGLKEKASHKKDSQKLSRDNNVELNTRAPMKNNKPNQTSANESPVSNTRHQRKERREKKTKGTTKDAQSEPSQATPPMYPYQYPCDPRLMGFYQHQSPQGYYPAPGYYPRVDDPRLAAGMGYPGMPMMYPPNPMQGQPPWFPGQVHFTPSPPINKEAAMKQMEKPHKEVRTEKITRQDKVIHAPNEATEQAGEHIGASQLTRQTIDSNVQERTETYQTSEQGEGRMENNHIQLQHSPPKSRNVAAEIQNFSTPSPLGGVQSNISIDNVQCHQSDSPQQLVASPEVFLLLKQQDAQLKALQAQINMLLAAQNTTPQKPELDTTTNMNVSPESQGYVSMDNITNVPSPRHQVAKETNSIATNTSLWLNQPDKVSYSTEHSGSQAVVRGYQQQPFDNGTSIEQGSETNESLSLSGVHITMQQEKASFVSDMIVDVPSYASSPDKSPEQYRDDMESASMCDGPARMPRYEASEVSQYSSEASTEQSHPDMASGEKQYYDNLILNVKNLLAQHTPGTTEDHDAPSDPHEGYYKEKAEKQLQADVEMPSTRIPAEVDVETATRNRLKKLGIGSMAKSQVPASRSDPSFYYDSALLPRLNYVSMLLDDQKGTNSSMEINALAMKYLSDQQLTQVAKIPNDTPRKVKNTLLRKVLTPTKADSPSDVTNFGMSANNMSFSTKKYLERYGLIQSDSLSGDNCSDEDSSQCEERVPTKVTFCLDDNAPSPRHDWKPQQRVHMFRNSSTPSEQSEDLWLFKNKPHEMQRHSLSRSNSDSLVDGFREDPQEGDRILDIERLKQLPKLM